MRKAVKKIPEVIEFVEKHGLVNKLLERLTSPEALEALAYGATKAALEKQK